MNQKKREAYEKPVLQSKKEAYEEPVLVKHELLRDITAKGSGGGHHHPKHEPHGPR